AGTLQFGGDLGWSYFEKLAGQNVMQVQSAADPPKKLALGERAVMADGADYGMFLMKEAGQPGEGVYAAEGTPLIIGPNGIFKAAPNPNTPRVLQSWMFSAECQQLIIDIGGLRSAHPHTKDRPGRKPLRDIRAMKDDPVAVEREADEIKARYTRIFRV